MTRAYNTPGGRTRVSTSFSVTVWWQEPGTTEIKELQFLHHDVASIADAIEAHTGYSCNARNLAWEISN